MNSTQAWVNYLSKVELPVLANTLRRINELTDSTSSTVNQLANVILNDAQLTSQVLRLSNTVFYNQTRTQVGTVSRAITLIGFDVVKSMAISSLIVDTLLARSDRSHLLQCLARALHAAVQARCLLPKRNEQALEEVFIGALLMNIGELAFWSCDTEQAGELEVLLQREEPAIEAQKKVLRTTFVEITRGLVDAWSLGPFIKDVVAAGQPNSQAASLVRHSVEMARLSEKGWRGAEMDRVLDALAGEVGESTGTVRDQVRINAGEASKIASSLGIPQVGALLPDGRASAEQKTPGAPATDPALELQILRQLSHSLSNKPDINEVCQLVIDGIQKAIGMKRIALLMADRSGNKLIPRKVAGPGTEPWREGFVVARDGSGELGLLLPQKVCGIYHPARQTVTPGFDPWLCQVPALTGPLLANGRLVGMFYADNADIHAVPEAGQLASFSHLVQHAQLCITLLSSH